MNKGSMGGMGKGYVKPMLQNAILNLYEMNVQM